ncbi:MAG: hypothetical protein ACYC27_19675 [Armatimonadota bacterium]
MALADLVEVLRTDLADPEGERFSDIVLSRCILRSVPMVARDLGLEMSISGNDILNCPPQGESQEMLILAARIEACRFMRAATASAFSFSSGDKRVDKTSQPEQWAKLETDLSSEYRERLHAMSLPGSLDDGYIITPRNVTPMIYEQGVDLDDITSF